jgi:peptide/nickel transport system permease protein
MIAFLAKRIGSAVVVLVCVLVVVSLVVRLIPGDPIDFLMMGAPSITKEQRETLRQQLGLSSPLTEQVARIVVHAAEGDLGQSVRFRRPAMQVVTERLPATIELTLVAMALAVAISIPLGIATAVRRGTLLDHFGLAVTTLGVSVPSFLLGMLLILLFSVTLHWLPASGRGDEALPMALWDALNDGDWEDFTGSVTHLVLPSVALAFSIIAWNARLTRGAMLEVINLDYIQFARAKGLSERLVILRHAFRNALIPTITITGLQFGYLLSGAFIVESVFAWPGVGRLAVQAILGRDYPLVQAIVVLTAAMFLTLNILIDIVYRLADPRVAHA